MSLKIDKHLYAKNMPLLVKVLISERISTTYEIGSEEYPPSEARFATVEAWERYTGRNFYQEFSILHRASWGAA